MRKRLWKQRFQEAYGGKAGEVLASQCGMTAMICSYTVLRSRGYRMTPLSMRTLPLVSGVFCAGLLGVAFGNAYSKTVLGDHEQKNWLMANKGAIISGTQSMDRQ